MSIDKKLIARIVYDLREEARGAILHVENSQKNWFLHPGASLIARDRAVRLFNGLSYLLSELDKDLKDEEEDL